MDIFVEILGKTSLLFCHPLHKKLVFCLWLPLVSSTQESFTNARMIEMTDDLGLAVDAKELQNVDFDVRHHNSTTTTATTAAGAAAVVPFRQVGFERPATHRPALSSSPLYSEDLDQPNPPPPPNLQRHLHHAVFQDMEAPASRLHRALVHSDDDTEDSLSDHDPDDDKDRRQSSFPAATAQSVTQRKHRSSAAPPSHTRESKQTHLWRHSQCQTFGLFCFVSGIVLGTLISYYVLLYAHAV